MKRTLRNIICLLLIAIPLQAQDAQENLSEDIPDNLLGQRPEHLTYEEMTDLMTNELHLDEKQQTKLTKINRRFKTLIEGEQHHPPMMGDMGGGPSGDMGGGNHMGNHQGGGRMGGMAGGPMGGGMSGGPMGGGMGGGPMGGGMGGGRMGSMGGGPMGGMSGGPGGHEAYDYDRQQQKYDKKVRKLFTDEQYEGYQQIKSQFYSQRRIREFLLGK